MPLPNCRWALSFQVSCDEGPSSAALFARLPRIAEIEASALAGRTLTGLATLGRKCATSSMRVRVIAEARLHLSHDTKWCKHERECVRASTNVSDDRASGLVRYA